MTPGDADDRLDDEFARLLAVYDESLASGQLTPLDDAELLRRDPALFTRLQEAYACLRQLERKWPRSCSLLTTPGADSGPDDLPDSIVRELPRELSRFEIQRRLGQGGHGVVFLAFDTFLRRPVALKLPRPDSLLTPGMRQRFLREARATAGFKHPNLITVYDAGEAGPLCYIAEAYCEGPNLSTWLRQQREPVSPRLAADLVRKLAAAVAHAHAQGIVHRDLKPSNVLLEPHPSARAGQPREDAGQLPFIPKVTDFGLAKLLDAENEQGATLTLSICGTAPYMAPEQAEGRREEIDARTDVYALGVLLYEILTGQTPFRGAAAPEILRRIVFDDPTPPHRLRPGVPRDLEAICLKCLEKLPARRYNSAEALAEDLDRFLLGEPTAARPIGHGRRALKWARRRPALAALAALCALAIVALVAGSWWHAVRLASALKETEASRIQADRQRDLALYQEGLVREREARLRRYLYASDMKQAFTAWNNFRLGETLDLLSRDKPKPHEEDLRGFGWYYLWRLSHGELLTLRGHTGDVSSVAFAPDGRRLATASFDGTAKLWNAVTGEELATFLKGHKEELNAVAFSPDGKTLATAGDDSAVRLWDVENRRQRALLLGHKDDVITVSISPDGKTLASGGEDQIVRVWDAATGKEKTTLRGHHGRIRALAYSPDGTKLATAGGDADAKIWDLATGRVQTTFTGHRWPDGLYQHLIVVSIAFSHNGKLVASGGDDHAVRIWDPTTGREQSVLRGIAEVAETVQFTPDDRILAAAAKDGNVWFWDVATGIVRNTIRAHADRLRSATLSPDGRTLATGSADRTAKLWAVGDDQSRRTISRLPGAVQSLGFLPGGKQLAAAGYMDGVHRNPGAFTLWDVSADRGVLFQQSDHEIPGNPSLSPDGTNIVVSRHGSFGLPRDDDPRHLNGIIFRASLDTNWRFAPFALSFPPNRVAFTVSCDAVSVGGESLAVGDDTGTVEVWKLRRRASGLVMATGLGTLVHAIAFSTDSKLLAAGGQNGDIKLWDAETGAERAALRGHQGQINYLCFSGDGSILASASADNTAKLWDVATARERTTLRGHNGDVRTVALSPDGRTAATGVDGGTVTLWDIATAQEIASLDAQRGGVQAVTFSPDGKILASGGAANRHEGQVILWRAADTER